MHLIRNGVQSWHTNAPVLFVVVDNWEKADIQQLLIKQQQSSTTPAPTLGRDGRWVMGWDDMVNTASKFGAVLSTHFPMDR